jgi:hypothetical protein
MSPDEYNQQREAAEACERQIAQSDLSREDKNYLRDFVAGYPGLDPSRIPSLISDLKEIEANYMVENQLRLFSELELQTASVPELEAARDRLNEIAQEGSYDNLHEHDQFADFDLVEARIEVIDQAIGERRLEHDTGR